ncbi:RND superfamily putative drug exporter [Nocardioides massiliensis]|uniref:RND superfamily putative drug exporter n=3 Tax=Nocardioides massiliensis TaxID=1325935 RepID=A0ABT9NRQ4_9ACTN|nr:MMPL family transporter [Nocardioides massiliensis]MDP9823102.1 RND superfamily putative drug exporter [Nocardioides massiliensis]
MPSAPARPGPFARVVTGRSTAWVVALLPLLMAGVVLGLVGEAERERLPTDSLPTGYDSTAAAALRDQLPDDASAAIILWTVEDGELGRDQLPVLTEQAQELADGGDEVPVVPAEDGTAAIAIVPVEFVDNNDNADRIAEMRETLRDGAPDGVEVRVTGPAAIQADLAGVFDGANLRLLLVTASVVTVLLVVTYRSPILWFFPLLVVGVADRTAAIAATHVLKGLEDLGLTVAWDESTIGILSVLVFGAGTNYALLLISRFRDELGSHEHVREAMASALRRTLEPVLASATTVVLGVLALVLSLIPATRGLGIACAVGIIIAAFAILVVLPAVLSCTGRWVFWPRVPREGQPALADGRGAWRRIGDTVARRPSVALLGTIVVLGALASGTLSISTGLDRSEQFLDEPEAITAAERLADSFPAGTSDPSSIVTRADARDVVAAAEQVEGVGSVRPSAQAEGITQLDVVLSAEPSSPEAEQAVVDLREALADFEDTHVGGAEAEAIDERDATGRDRLVVMPLILGLVFVALIILLRSLVAPVVLALAVVLSYAAAMGVGWWVFTGPLGFTALDSSVPLLSFLFLVALGVDYSIFLVTRAREEAAGFGTREGILRALAATGGVITSAGILLAAVFAVLGVLPLVVLAQVGTIICIGVLLDTLIVRTILVPAVARLLGETFWWPRRVHETGKHAARADA